MRLSDVPEARRPARAQLACGPRGRDRRAAGPAARRDAPARRLRARPLRLGARADQDHSIPRGRPRQPPGSGKCPGARARSPARWPADRRRGPRPGAGLPPRGLRSRLCGTPRRSVDIRAARVRTRPPPAWRPTRPGARYDSRCTRSARRASPRDPAAGRGCCDRGAGRSPCRWWSACGTRRNRRRASRRRGSDASASRTSGSHGRRDTPGFQARGACRCAGRGSPSTSRHG